MTNEQEKVEQETQNQPETTGQNQPEVTQPEKQEEEPVAEKQEETQDEKPEETVTQETLAEEKTEAVAEEAKPTAEPEEESPEEKAEEERQETVAEEKAVEEPPVETEQPEAVKAEETNQEAAAEEKPEEKSETDTAQPETPQVEQPEDFDWDSIGKKQDNYTKEEREKLEEFYNKTFNSVAEHEVVDGTIVSLTDREVVVNINFKSDGVIPRAELRYNPDFKVGDKIEVYVESQEDQSGQLLLSHKKARILKSWERVNEAYEKEEVIKGYVKEKND